MAELIIALDTSSDESALALVELLHQDIHWFKIGLQLFVSCGPALVGRIKNHWPQVRIFLDLKFYDIPNTAARAAVAVAGIGADMLTVHCQGGERMCVAVMDALHGSFARIPIVLGVTALTSFAPGEMPGIDSSPLVFGVELAKMAANWGLGGVVCSGWEAPEIKAVSASLKLVCPGIRPYEAEAGDQRRVMTAAQAVERGADFLVVGRPVTASAHPAAAARAILAEMKSGKQRSCRGE